MRKPKVLLKRVNANVFDVFHGNDGWEDWTRVVLMQSRLRHVSGRRMSPPELAATYEALPKKEAK